jgi:ribonuclease HI
VGGVLYDPRGNHELNYYWNIGITSNNKVEAYVVYQGVQLEKQRQIYELNIVGDSKNTIRYFVLGSSSKDTRIEKLD